MFRCYAPLILLNLLLLQILGGSAACITDAFKVKLMEFYRSTSINLVLLLSPSPLRMTMISS